MRSEHSADVISSAMGFRGSGSHFLDNTGALCLQGDRWLQVGVLPRTCQHRSWQVRWQKRSCFQSDADFRNCCHADCSFRLGFAASDISAKREVNNMVMSLGKQPSINKAQHDSQGRGPGGKWEAAGDLRESTSMLNSGPGPPERAPAC